MNCNICGIQIINLQGYYNDSFRRRINLCLNCGEIFNQFIHYRDFACKTFEIFMKLDKEKKPTSFNLEIHERFSIKIGELIQEYIKEKNLDFEPRKNVGNNVENKKLDSKIS